MNVLSAGKSFFAATVLALASVLVIPSAQAIPLLGNLANADSSNDYGGTPDSADQFMTGNAALSISDIDVYWADGNGGTANRVGIFTDAGGLPSGTQIGTWFTSALATTSDTVINYAGGVAMLLANTTYHLVIDILDGSEAGFTFNPAEVSDPSTQGATNLPLNSSFGDIQTVSWSEDPANLVWQINGATAVTAVPAPATLGLLGLGLVGIGFGRRRR
jgi:hypothetical protein